MRGPSHGRDGRGYHATCDVLIEWGANASERCAGVRRMVPRMLIRVGYDMALHFLQPTAMVLMQSLSLRGASTIRQPERVEVQPDVAVAEFIDAFGNRCSGHDLRTAPYRLKEDVICRDGPQRV